MKLYTFQTGEMSVNTYVFVNEETRLAVAFDVGGDASFLTLNELKYDFKITDIILTHGHFDHIGGVYDFYKKGVKVHICEKEKDFINNSDLNLSSYFSSSVAPFEIASYFSDGDLLKFNQMTFKVIETPGHTKGSCSFIIDNYLITGDTLFNSSFGRTDFPTGDIKTLIKSIKKLFSLENDYIVLSGHGDRTMLSIERKNNPIKYYDNN